MLDYKKCSIEDFNKAMENKDTDVKELSNEYLYILYTKFNADASACFQAGTSYAMGLSMKSKNRVNTYKEELHNRGINVFESQ